MQHGLSDLSNDLFCQDFLYVFIRVCICYYILMYTPKRVTNPLRYKHLETDYKKSKHY